MKKEFLYLCLAFLAFMPFSLRADSIAFLSGFEDLPLMSQMSQTNDDVLSFGASSGRIVTAYAEGNEVTALEIEAFYDKTLPQLGWVRLKEETAKKSYAYKREGEVLTISVEEASPTMVRFDLMTKEKD